MIHFGADGFGKPVEIGAVGVNRRRLLDQGRRRRRGKIEMGANRGHDGVVLDRVEMAVQPRARTNRTVTALRSASSSSLFSAVFGAWRKKFFICSIMTRLLVFATA